MKFDVKVIETLEKTVIIDANDEDEAERIAIRRWLDELIVLTADDFERVNFEVKERNKK